MRISDWSSDVCSSDLDLPGLPFAETVADTRAVEVPANSAVPQYFDVYERKFGLLVYRPVKVIVVCEREGRLRIETDKGLFSAQGIINATGTWDKPYIPEYPGASLFEGAQLHTRDYQTAAAFAGKQVQIGRASGRERWVSTCRSRWSPYHSKKKQT